MIEARPEPVLEMLRSLLRRILTAVKALAGREVRVRTNLSLPTERFGGRYAGWEVATEGLNADSIVYSFGVGEDVSFDEKLIERFGLTVHAFDPTPRSIQWVRRRDLPPQFVMHEYGIASYDGTARFTPPQNPDHVSHTMLDRKSSGEQSITVPVMRLATIVDSLGHDEISVLKMDVEGAEYAVIPDIADSRIRPLQILVEFHHRFAEVDLSQTYAAIDTLRSMGYKLYWVSPSNEEFSFILAS